MIILDTCALIFWTLDPNKLSAKAYELLSGKNKIGINSISIWEIGIKNKQKKLELPISLQDYVTRLQKINNFSIFAVDHHIWLKNIQLEWEHKDPADRTIVATAMIYNCPLLTSDQKILSFYSQAVW